MDFFCLGILLRPPIGRGPLGLLEGQYGFHPAADSVKWSVFCMLTALVTGGSRGIGAQIVRDLCANGYRVAFFFLASKDKARALSQETGAHAIVCDVRDAQSVNQACEQARQLLGHIDVLVNNAGVAQQKLFTDITDEEWDDMIGIHLSGTFRCCRAVLPEMIRRREGTIVNVSSMWGQIGGSCEVHYSAAKAGIIGLTKALAKEVGLSGITVNCIAPGVIRTAMLDTFSEEDLAALAEETPVGRIGTPEDVADTAVFLAGDGARFISGQVIGVNGGFVV